MSDAVTGESLSQLQRRGRAFLAACGIDTAALDARLLLQAATELSPEALILQSDKAPSPNALARFEGFLRARAAHKPVSRIVGQREFWGLTLAVSPDTLDPRPDTETLVEAVLRHTGRHTRPFIRDLGTGSGAILLALLTALPGARGVGSDISAGALAVARGNAQAMGLGARAGFLLSDWAAVDARRADILVSNPPYIARGALPSLMTEVRRYDPPQALDGGADGLAPYRAIMTSLPRLVRPGALLAFEIGPTQGRRVQALLARCGAAIKGPGLGLQTDLAGRERVVVARAPRQFGTEAGWRGFKKGAWFSRAERLG